MDKNEVRKTLNKLTGNFVSGKKFMKALEEIVDYINYCEEEKIRYKKTLEEYNKDAEIQKYKKLLEETRKNSLLIMSENETKAEKSFREKHYKKCKNGSTYQYEITGTGIGNCISIKCPVCGESQDITDTTTW